MLCLRYNLAPAYYLKLSHYNQALQAEMNATVKRIQYSPSLEKFKRQKKPHMLASS